MYWQKKKLDYNILIPPLNKPFKKFTQKEAENYFIWHTNQLKSRIEYLQNYSCIDLNLSLIHI